MEQGKLDEAVIAYQQMADLNPDSQAATRAAHVRWLKGDLAGAIAMLEQAASAVDSRDAEMAAWIFTRLASLKWQAAAGGSLSDAQLGEGELSAASTEIRSLLGSHTQTGRRKDAVPSPGGEGQGDAGRSHTIPDFTAAQRDLETALALRSNYPPALLLHGKMLLAENKFSAAIEPLRLAEQQNPLPEYQWALIDALLSAGQSVEAGAIEARLKRTGAATDPRSFALFLATRGEQPTLALRLALEELTTRADVFTHDAVAWTQLANGNVAEAQRHMDRALAAGTSDPRLFLHAAIIASRAGPPPVVAGCVQKSSALAHLLLPSERKQLATITALLPASPVVVSLAPTPQASSVGGK
jgi:tetratricopeptide (TPR) repeat protein